MEKIFLLDGLRDEAHGAEIAKSVRSLPGVFRASFLYTTGKMTVVFDETKTDVGKIIDAAVKLGGDIASL